MRVEWSADIEGSPEAVFDVLADPARRPEWIGSILESRQTSPGPLEVGSTFVDMTFMGRGPQPVESIVTVLDRPGAIAFRQAEPTETETRYELMPSVRGTTIHFTMDIHVPWYLLPGAWYARRTQLKQMDDLFADLEDLVRS
jgi:uncharacterized protein YndB with AHSA1/START domain